MKLTSTSWVASSFLGAALANQFDTKSYASKDVITRDVAVVGGGSTGTYAAIRLRDLDQSVVVVEKQSVLGGHTNTYTDPTTGTRIDFGVQTYSNYSVVRDFFARFDIPTTLYDFGGSNRVFADFKTGQAFPGYTPSFDFAGYQAQLQKYPYLVTTWTLPTPVPEDLLLPFGQFLRKHSLQDIAFAIWSNTWGCGDILNQPAVYMLKAIDEPFLSGLTAGTITTARRDNHELYDKALAELGPDALVSSTVVATQRPAKGRSGKVKLVVKTPTGKKLVIADKLLVSAPPLLTNLGSWDLDQHERSLFSKFSNSALYVFLVTDTGLPAGYSFQNALPPSSQTFAIPKLPGLYHVNPTAVEGIFVVWYGGPRAVKEADAKADISKTIIRLRGTVEGSSSSKTPRFLAFDSHTPFQLAVSPENIRKGFYRDLEGLQGHKNTWYTGAAFLSHHAGQLWNFTEALLPAIIDA